jgi:hypothetical protein
LIPIVILDGQPSLLSCTATILGIVHPLPQYTDLTPALDYMLVFHQER